MKRILLMSSLALLASCYDAKVTDGAVLCGPGGACPSGHVCASNNVCYRAGDDLSFLSEANPYGNGALGALTLASGGTLTLFTNTGEITFQAAAGGSSQTLVQPMSVFAQTQPSGPPVAIWSFSSISIPASVNVQVSSDSLAVPVLAATNTLNMLGSILLDGSGGLNGSPSAPGTNPYGPPSGGGGGGTAGDVSGGGGGGYAGVGGPGLGVSGGGGGGGAAYGSDTATPVFFGAGGGGGSATSGNVGGVGGTGGGAIVLLAESMDLEGRISCNGLPGGNSMTGGGGGGGAGGTILVSGNQVIVGSGATISAIGGQAGQGAGGVSGGAGADGRIYVTANMPFVNGTFTPSPMPGTTALTAFPPAN